MPCLQPFSSAAEVWVGVRGAEERERARMGWRGLSCPLGCFSGLFFKLKKKKKRKERKSGCLRSRLIIAERLGAGTAGMCFHTCADGLRAYSAAGAASLESMWERACFLRGCRRWSEEGGGRRGPRGASFDTRFLWRVRRALQPAASPTAGRLQVAPAARRLCSY